MKALAHRTGRIAIIGRPNVGKSTLLNRMVGMKISITSNRPQTTRHRLNAIVTEADAQMVLVDTPGFQTEHGGELNRLMNRTVSQSLDGVDAVLLVIEAMKFGADSRQIERCFAELFGVKPPESKSYYDFAVEINKGGGVVISAASVKSKEAENLRDFRDTTKRKKLRGYLEIANANAKDWKLCRATGLTEEHFRAHKYPSEFGAAILQRQIDERAAAEARIQKQRKHAADRVVDAKASVFLSVMYSPMDKNFQRDYLVSSYPIILPKPERWEFRSKALVGFDKNGGVLYEWYALSGSQFKYYPLVDDRTYGSKLFQLLKPAQESLHQKSVRMFGHT